jgi:hypothetical protein
MWSSYAHFAELQAPEEHKRLLHLRLHFNRQSSVRPEYITSGVVGVINEHFFLLSIGMQFWEICKTSLVN